MANLIGVLPNYRVNLALSELNTIQTQNVYLACGRISPWPNEIDPPDPGLYSTADIIETKLGLIFYKRVVAGVSAILGTRRVTWVSGQVYTFYDNQPQADGVDLINKNYYVLTKERHVFKCIWNNNGQPSTVEPYIATPTEILDTSDGYRWKYLYTIPYADYVNFTTGQYMPIRTSTLGLPNGAVIEAKIIDQGTNILTSTGSSGNIQLTIVGSGANATGYAVIRNGMIANIVITNGGSGYDINTSASFTDSNGNVYNVQLIVNEVNPYYDSVTSSALARSAGIEHIIIYNKGAFYETGTTITFVGDGSGATGTPVLKSTNVIQEIFVTSVGDNILSADVSISSVLGQGKNATAVISQIREGKVYSITMTNFGEGYLNAADIVVTLKNVVPVNASNSVVLPTFQVKVTQTNIIDKITITNPGSGYRNISIKVNSTYGSLFSSRAIIDPISGHGGDVPNELFASTIIYSSEVSFEGEFGDGSTGDFPVSNDIRQNVLVTNPLTFSGAPLTDLTANACYRFTIDSNTGMTLDSIWYGTTNNRIQLKLVSLRTDGASLYAFFNSVGFDEPVTSSSDPNFTDSITLSTDNTVQHTVSQILNPEVNVFSGSLIYVENRPPYTRSDEQIEVLKGVIRY